MLYFFACVLALILGYVVYGRFVDNVFGPDPNRPTPAQALADGVDYVEMSPRKIFLIQLLNIAGLGPIFGPILGALYGPSALVWIVIGSIFAGAVHDYFSGMLSIRHDGKSIPDVVGVQLGNGFKQFMRLFSIVLLLLVGIVFVLGPAKLLGNMSGLDVRAWVDDYLRLLLSGHHSAHSENHRSSLSAVWCRVDLYGGRSDHCADGAGL